MQTQSYDFCALFACIIGGAGGSPVPVDKPRVLRTINVGEGAGIDPRQIQQQIDRRDQAEWKRRFERILRLQVAMFDTDDESDMDLIQEIDGTCRKYDSIMEKKAERAELVKAEMAELERAGKSLIEFNEVRWMQLDDQLKLLRRSWLKWRTAFEVALFVRHAVNGHTGGRWGEYKRSADFKAQRRLDMKQRLATVDASTAVGLSPTDYAAWRQWRLSYEPSVDGVDALPDIAGAGAADVKKLADRQLQQAIAERVRPKVRARVVPKAGVEFEPSGKRGERHAALTRSLRKLKPEESE